MFDVTNFRDHPGTHQKLLQNAGKDETDAFERAAHPKQALNWTKDFYVGRLQKQESNPKVCYFLCFMHKKSRHVKKRKGKEKRK